MVAALCRETLFKLLGNLVLSIRCMYRLLGKRRREKTCSFCVGHESCVTSVHIWSGKQHISCNMGLNTDNACKVIFPKAFSL